MRNVRIVSISLDSDLALELKRFSFTYFDGNSSKAISECLKTFIPRYQREKEELIKKFSIPEPTPKEEEQERIKKEEREKELAERKRKSEEYKKSLKTEPKTEPQVEKIKSDPNYPLWQKHEREIRLNPDNHNPYDCYWCKLYPDLMRICTERG